MTDYKDLAPIVSPKIKSLIGREANHALLRYSPLSDQAISDILRVRDGIDLNAKTIWTLRQAQGIRAAYLRRYDYLQETLNGRGDKNEKAKR